MSKLCVYLLLSGQLVHLIPIRFMFSVRSFWLKRDELCSS